MHTDVSHLSSDNPRLVPLHQRFWIHPRFHLRITRSYNFITELDRSVSEPDLQTHVIQCVWWAYSIRRLAELLPPSENFPDLNHVKKTVMWAKEWSLQESTLNLKDVERFCIEVWAQIHCSLFTSFIKHYTWFFYTKHLGHENKFSSCSLSYILR